MKKIKGIIILLMAVLLVSSLGFIQFALAQNEPKDFKIDIRFSSPSAGDTYT
jgi:hypothetical protein